MKQILTILMIFCALAAGAAGKAPKGAKQKGQNHQSCLGPSRAASGPRTVCHTCGRTVCQKGLAGKNIALWQSHGRYFDQNEERWMWQSAHGSWAR